MKRNVTRIALLLVLTMIIGIVAGCDKTTPVATTAAPTGSTTASTTGAATTTGSAFPNLNPPGTLPVVKEKETLKLTTVQSSLILDFSYGVNKLTTYLQDRTNVVIDFQFYPEADATTKLNLEL